MKIVILSKSAKIYSTARLVSAAEARGHRVEVIDPLKCSIVLSGGTPVIKYQGAPLAIPSAVIPRIGASVTYYGCAILRQLELMGAATLNSASAINQSRDKLIASQIMAAENIAQPLTAYASSTHPADELIAEVGNSPVVIKLLVGTQGKGVLLTKTKATAKSVIAALRGVRAKFVVQEFIREANCKDLRCIVVGGQVVAAMQRSAKGGEFRANLHAGGTAEQIELTAQESAAAISAAQALDIDFGGVDLIRSSGGPLVLEVNSSPGLGGIEAATGLDIASLVVAHLENLVAKA